MTRRNGLILAAVLGVAVYAVLWIGVAAQWTWLISADMWTLRRLLGFGTGTQAWLWLSDVFSPAVLRIIGLVGIAIALVRRESRIAGFLALTVLPAGLVTAVAKALVARPRPETAVTYVASTSFPSGHALAITVGVLALLTLCWPRVTSSMRVLMVLVGGVLVFLVGLSRVALNVHHPSDVIAGWVLGGLYFLLCVTLVPPRISAV